MTEKALFDRMVRVVPSTLPMTFSELEPNDSRLRPLKLAFWMVWLSWATWAWKSALMIACCWEVLAAF